VDSLKKVEALKVGTTLNEVEEKKWEFPLWSELPNC